MPGLGQRPALPVNVEIPDDDRQDRLPSSLSRFPLPFPFPLFPVPSRCTHSRVLERIVLGAVAERPARGWASQLDFVVPQTPRMIVRADSNIGCFLGIKEPRASARANPRIERSCKTLLTPAPTTNCTHLPSKRPLQLKCIFSATRGTSGGIMETTNRSSQSGRSCCIPCVNRPDRRR